MPNPFQTFIVISGKTGSGKSAVLKSLSLQRYPVIDLEEIAVHKGSAFGAAGNAQAQPSQPAFERELQQIGASHTSPFIFIEQKPSSIGKRQVPDWFYKKMMEGLIVQLHVPKELRVQNILKEYFDTEKKQQNIFAAVTKLSERFLKEKILFLQKLLLKKNYNLFINEILDYYDQSSGYESNKKPFVEIFVKDEYNAENISREIIESLKRKGIMLS